MVQKYCVCGHEIQRTRELCNDCLSTYGSKSKNWPGWLREWIKFERHERYYERAHFDDDIDSLEYSLFQGDDNNIFARNKWVENAKSRKIDYLKTKFDNYIDAKLRRLFKKDVGNSGVFIDLREFAKNFASPTAPPPFNDERKKIDFWIDFRDAILELSEIEKKVILLYLFDFKEREIAAALNISQSHVNKIKNRGVIKLAALLT